MAPGFGEPEGGWVVVFPRLHDFVGCPSFEPNGYVVAIPDARFGANIRDPTQRAGS